MTRLNLAQTCLLHVSGELGTKAKAQLEEHVEQFPAALVEFELVKGQYAMLRSLPQPHMSSEQRRQIASAIKQGVHRKLRQQENARAAKKRWKLIYRAMAGVTGIAASLVIAAGMWMVQQHQDSQREATLARAEQQVLDYLDTDSENRTDYAYSEVASQIQSLESEQLLASEGLSNATTVQLLDALDMVREDGMPENGG